MTLQITRVMVTPNMLAEFADSIEPLQARGIEVVFNDGIYPMNAEQLSAWLGDAEAAIVGLDEISASVFDACPHLRVIARNGVGMDNVDLASASQAKVLVTTPLGANSTSVAELAFGMMISLVRHVIPTHNRVQNGVWKRVAGIELSGKTLGIIGLGRIGKKVARRAQAFNMRVIAHDIAPDAYFARENQIPMLSLEQVLSQSDIISLHVPLTILTHHLINPSTITQMIPGSYLINTARGNVVDMTALANALDSGHIAGAALDVHPTDHEIDPLMKGRDNVITTTHLGAYTRDSLRYTTEMAIHSILQLLEGQQPEGLMNPEIWGKSDD